MTVFARLRRKTWMVAVLLAAGRACASAVELPSPTTPAPAASQAASLAAKLEFDRALAAAAKYLQSRQSDDGAWRSPVYGTFKQGDALTPLLVITLQDLQGATGAHATPAITAGQRYLSAMIDDAGKVLPPEHGVTYPVYTAAGAIIALARTPSKKSTAARDAWLRYLRERQLTEALGWTRDDPQFGGWGYAPGLPQKPQAGAPLGDLAEPNLSATVFALAALRAVGAGTDDPAVQSALCFVRGCQNFAADPSQRDPRFDDGGFHFVLADPVRNKAGLAGTDRNGQKRFASYGSATADGLRALLLCGVAADEPRVAAAWNWLARHFTADSHPGAYAADRYNARESVYFYYCHAMLNALAMREATTDVAVNNRRAWANAVAKALIARQRDDGSWRNAAVDVREDDPLVATSLAAGALVRCRAILLQTGQ